MATHHVLGLLYIWRRLPQVLELAARQDARALPSRTRRWATSARRGSTSSTAPSARSRWARSTASTLRAASSAASSSSRPPASARGANYNISDAAIGPVVELVLDTCFVLMLGFSCFILKVSGGRAYQWVAKGLWERRDDANADEEVGDPRPAMGWCTPTMRLSRRYCRRAAPAGARGGGRSPAARGTPGGAAAAGGRSDRRRGSHVRGGRRPRRIYV